MTQFRSHQAPIPDIIFPHGPTINHISDSLSNMFLYLPAVDLHYTIFFAHLFLSFFYSFRITHFSSSFYSQIRPKFVRVVLFLSLRKLDFHFSLYTISYFMAYVSVTAVFLCSTKGNCSNNNTLEYLIGLI